MMKWKDEDKWNEMVNEMIDGKKHMEANDYAGDEKTWGKGAQHLRFESYKWNFRSK